MTVTKNKKDTVKNGIEERCRTMPEANDDATTSCYTTIYCNVTTKVRAKNSKANASKVIDYNTGNRHKEQINDKLDLSKATKTNVPNNAPNAQCTQTNALKMKRNGLQRERERPKEVVDKLRGEVIDLDKMINKNVSERGVQAEKTDFVGNRDRLDYLRNHNISFIKLTEDDFEQRTTSLRTMRDAMLNNLNQTINIMNKQYERRKSSLFRLADENRDAMTNDQYQAARHLQALLACSGRQQ